MGAAHANDFMAGSGRPPPNPALLPLPAPQLGARMLRALDIAVDINSLLFLMDIVRAFLFYLYLPYVTVNFVYDISFCVGSL